MVAVSAPQVGVSAVVVRAGLVLLGLRQGAHGSGTWGLPGGKLDAAEHPSDAVRRELHEETALVARRIEPLRWTNDVFLADGLHFVTLHHLVEADGEPVVTEPGKLVRWAWWSWDAVPQPLFPAFASLVDSGWRP